jgi:UDP-N-acetylmuramate--alanine ligase
VPGRGSGRAGRGRWLVVEADESEGRLPELEPAVAVLTNCEADHLEHLGSLDGVEAQFARFLMPKGARAPAGGGSAPSAHLAPVLCWDDPGVRRVAERASVQTLLRYGLEQHADLRAANVSVLPDGGSTAEVSWHGEKLGVLRLSVPGRHNLLNAMAAVAVGRLLGVTFGAAAGAIEAFEGVERRFQRHGHYLGAEVVDDYAHHPTEIPATIAAARTLAPRRLVVAFPPHRFTRTRDQLGAFPAALSGADLLWLTDVYAAGESAISGADSHALLDAVRTALPTLQVHYSPSLQLLEAELRRSLRKGDLLLLLGAGDIHKLASRLAPGSDRAAADV